MNLFKVVVAMLLAKVSNLMVVVDKVQNLATGMVVVVVEVDILECLKHLLLPLQQIPEINSMQF